MQDSHTHARTHAHVHTHTHTYIHLDLEKVNIKDPDEFWKAIKKMGKGKQDLPNEVYGDDGEILSDLPSVLERWMTEFGLLFSSPPPPEQLKNNLCMNISVEKTRGRRRT